MATASGKIITVMNPLRIEKEDIIMIGKDKTIRGKKATSWDREANFTVDGKAASIGDWENSSTRGRLTRIWRLNFCFVMVFLHIYYFNIQDPVLGLVCSFPPEVWSYLISLSLMFVLISISYLLFHTTNYLYHIYLYQLPCS